MLYPSFQIFDAPSREICAVDRPRTNTPLQALVTLNDPTYVESARVFGQRIAAADGDIDQKLVRAYRDVLSRAPTADEVAVLKATHAEQLERFRNGEDAQQLLAAGGSLPVVDESALRAGPATVEAVPSRLCRRG